MIQSAHIGTNAAMKGPIGLDIRWRCQWQTHATTAAGAQSKLVRLSVGLRIMRRAESHTAMNGQVMANATIAMPSHELRRLMGVGLVLRHWIS
jgi:hypothetical protein